MTEILQLIGLGGAFAGAFIGAAGLTATVERALAGRKLRIRGDAGFAEVIAKTKG